MSNKYAQEYQSKLKSAAEACKTLPKKSLIAVGGFAQEPLDCLANLHEAYDQIDEATVYGVIRGDAPYISDERYRDKFFVTPTFSGPAARANHVHGRVSFIPLHLHACYSRYGEVNTPNVIISCSPPMDKHGYFNLSMGGWEKIWAHGAERVIIEVVPDMPRVPGEFEIHISDVSAIVESKRNLPTMEAGALSDTDKAIGEYVASLVEDGSTIQLGIGAVPDASARALKGKKDLGIHTEMVTSSMAELANLGVVTNRRKTLHKDKTIGAFAFGDRMLYDWLDENPSVYFQSTNYVNDPYVVAQNYQMVSINTCIEVDLTGQIASETIGPRQFSGSGGQNDFAEGAIHSQGGKSIIAMASSGTKKDGTRFSKINAMLTQGAVVTMSRNNIDYIVTEFGIAVMKARPVRQRVENLIAIAHPDFREELRTQANKLMLW